MGNRWENAGKMWENGWKKVGNGWENDLENDLEEYMIHVSKTMGK